MLVLLRSWPSQTSSDHRGDPSRATQEPSQLRRPDKRLRQTHPNLDDPRLDARVTNLEGVNLGRLRSELVPDVIEVVAVDLSYLALAVAALQLEALSIAGGAGLLALVKPMYELGLATPPDSPADQVKAVELAVGGFERSGWEFRGAMPSPIRGRRGAIEHLMHLRCD